MISFLRTILLFVTAGLARLIIGLTVIVAAMLGVKDKPNGLFEKGPFVLAIAAGVPIIPVIVHGTIEIMPKGSLWAHPGTIDVHLLEPVSTTGVDYDHRETLMQTVRMRMVNAMRDLYGVES